MSSSVTGLSASGETERKKIAFHLYLSRQARVSLGTSAPTLMLFIHHLKTLNHTVDYFFYLPHFVHAVKTYDYDVAAISGVEIDLEHLLKLAVTVKRSNPCIVTAIGGFVTASYGSLLPLHPAVDCAFYGESEYSFPLFLKNLSRIQDPTLLRVQYSRPTQPLEQQFQKLWGEMMYRSPISAKVANGILNSTFLRFVDDGEKRGPFAVLINNLSIKTFEGEVLHKRENRPSFCDVIPLKGEIDALIGFDLDSMCVYPRRLLDPGRSSVPIPPKRSSNFSNVGLYIQRGCPTKPRCDICSIPYGPNRRPKVETVEALLDRIHAGRGALGQGHLWSVTFGDDCFAADRTWVLELCDMLRNRPARFLFGAQTRPRDLLRKSEPDLELIRALRAVKFALAIGLESFEPRRLELMGKTNDGEGYLRYTMAVLEACLSEELVITPYVILTVPESRLVDMAQELEGVASFLLRSLETYHLLPLVTIIKSVNPNSDNAFTWKRGGQGYHALHLTNSATLRTIRAGKVHERLVPLTILGENGRWAGGSLRIPVRFSRDPWVEGACREIDKGIAAFNRLHRGQPMIADYHLKWHAIFAEAARKAAASANCPSRKEAIGAAMNASAILKEVEVAAYRRYLALQKECDDALRTLTRTRERINRSRVLRSPVSEQNRVFLEEQLRLFNLTSTVQEVTAKWLDNQYRTTPFRSVYRTTRDCTLSDHRLRMFAAAKELDEKLRAGEKIEDVSYIPNRASSIPI